MQWVDFDLIDLRLAVTDSPVGTRPEMLVCPKHNDDTQSLAVYPDNIHCYGCGFHLSRRIKALAFLLKVSDGEAMQVAHRYTLDSLDAYRDRVTEQAKLEPLPRGLSRAYNLLLETTRSNRMRWFHDRGITRETVTRFELGHDGTRFTIPVFSADGKLLTFRYRRDDEYESSYFDARRGKEIQVPKYAGMRGRNGLYLFPEDAIAACCPYDDAYLVVVEGELDAVRLWQEGIPAVSTTNGAGQVHKIPALVKARFPSVKSLYIATDNDAPGDEAKRQTVSEASGLGFDVTEIDWDEAWGKDVTELYLNGHTLEEGYFVGDDSTLPDHH